MSVVITMYRFIDSEGGFGEVAIPSNIYILGYVKNKGNIINEAMGRQIREADRGHCR